MKHFFLITFILSKAQKISSALFEKEAFEVYPLKGVHFYYDREFLKQNFKILNRGIIFSLLLSLFLISCSQHTKTTTAIPLAPTPIDTSLEIPNKTVDKSALHYNTKNSLWTLNDQLYSGYAINYYQDSIPKEKIGILNGRKQNQALQWYQNGHYKEVANYHKGKLHGEKKMWSSDSNHILVAHLNYYLGKANGEQKKWYPTGELYKKLNLNMGKEEGIQQAFRKNGALFANYEARNGRIFGLKKSALCYGLEDENIQYKK